MPTWAKILIVVGLVIVLGVIAVIAGGAYWWSRNKDSLIARGKAEMTEGRDLGRTTDNQGCVDQSMLRYKKDPGFTSVIATTLYLKSCLDVSRATPGFCDEVPKSSEFTKSGSWRAEKCNEVGLGSDTYCHQLLAPVQDFCSNGSRIPQEDGNANTP